MKKLLLLVILACSTFMMNAQVVIRPDTVLSFTHRYYQCEGKWVVLPIKKIFDKYTFGFIYLDATAGLTFEFEGEFKIDANFKFTKVDNGPKTYGLKQRLGKTTNVLIALLPDDKIKELGLEVYPELLATYKIADPVLHDVAMGKTLNANNECATALPYLEKAYSINPNAPGVEFELGYTYNGLGKFKDAIRILKVAVKHHPEDISIYKELGFAETYNGDFGAALVDYKTGIGLDEKENFGYKVEMIYYIAMIYKDNFKDPDQFRLWGVKALKMAAPESFIFKNLKSLGLSLEDDVKPNETGTFTDERDGQIYKWVKIGNQTWMAQNLNFKTSEGSKSYNNDENNRPTYGLLYSYYILNQVSPKGWHVPSEAEWETLEIKQGMSFEDASGDKLYRGSIAGKFMEGGSSGFDVKFGGKGDFTKFNDLESKANFWSITRNGNPIFTRLFMKGDSRICQNRCGPAYILSVRCVKDEENK